MGARYFMSGQQTLASVADTALTVTSNSATVQRNRIYELNMGNVGTPADLVSIYLIGKVTTENSGNMTILVATNVDEEDRAPQALVGSNHTGEPTYVAGTVALNIPTNGDLLRVPLNHRATYRWVAPPGGELVTPKVQGDGIGGKSDHASATTDYMIGAHWIE